MGLYLGDKKGVLYKGAYKPVNLYHGSKKVAGWKFSEKTGTTIDWEDTYDDSIASIETEGNSWQYKLPDVGEGTYTHTRYCLRPDGIGMTDKPSLVESSGRNLVEGSPTASVDKWTKNGWTTGTISTLDPDNGIYKLVATPAWCTFKYKLPAELAGKLVTISFYGLLLSEETTSTIRNGLYVSNQSGNNSYLTGDFVQVGNTGSFPLPVKDVWIKFYATVELNSDCNLGICVTCNPEGESLKTTWYVKDLKIEKGSTATPWTPAPEDYPYYYQPYIGICKSNNPIAPTDPSAYAWTRYMPNPDAPLDIHNVGDNRIRIGTTGRDGQSYLDDRQVILRSLPDGAKDVYDIVNGKVTRYVKQRIFDGTENWNIEEHGNMINSYLVLADVIGDNKNPLLLCTHYPVVSGNASSGGSTPFCVGIGESRTLRFRGTGYDTVSSWKAFLSAQYAAGTPVTIYHKLDIPVIEDVEPMTLPTYPKHTRLTCSENITATVRVIDRDL